MKFVRPSYADPTFHLALDAIIEPGRQDVLAKRPGVHLHLVRLVATGVAHAPELRYFQRNVGGSRRRGRRASNLWAIAALIHAERRPAPLATIDSMQVLKREHVLAPIPIQLVRDGIEVTLIAPEDADVLVRVSNHEQHRKVHVALHLSGAHV